MVRRGLLSAAFLAALVIAAACSAGEALQDPGDPVDMTTASIAGTWHAGTERFITFGQDGTFTALNLPPDLFDPPPGPPGPPAPPSDAAGRYTLGHQSSATSGPHSTVKLSLDQPTGSVELLALRPGDGQVYLVFFYVGQQGNMTTGYLRCTTDCLPPTGGPSGSPAAGLGPAPHRS